MGPFLQDDSDHIEGLFGTAIGAVCHSCWRLCRSQHPLGDEKPDRQVEIVSRGSHRGADEFVVGGAGIVPANPDFKRLLDGDLVETSR
jgi:hypothetical protein